MGASKAELEAGAAAYDAGVAMSRALLGQGLISAAIDRAIEAWPAIEPMMQLQRRYHGVETARVAAIDIVLRYAPLVFRSDALDRLAVLLKANKRIDKNASADIAADLATASNNTRANHRLYEYLDANPGVRQDSLRSQLGGEQEHWRSVAEEWGRMHVLRRQPSGASYFLTLVTRMDEPTMGKCPRCGHVTMKSKVDLLDVRRCSKCAENVSFVLLGAAEEAN